MVRDKRTGKTKGYGFVSFKDPNDYVRAMREMNGQCLLPPASLQSGETLTSGSAALLRQVRGQPSHQAEEEHVEGPQHGRGPQEAEGEEEAGPPMKQHAELGCFYLHQEVIVCFCAPPSNKAIDTLNI